MKTRSGSYFGCGVVSLFVSLMFFLPSPVLAQKQFRLCHNSNIDAATDKAAHQFAALVEKKTGGQIKVIIYPRNQLGGNRELLEQVKMGSLEMTLLGLGTMGYMVEEYNFMQIPFAFRSQEHVHPATWAPSWERPSRRRLKARGSFCSARSGTGSPATSQASGLLSRPKI